MISTKADFDPVNTMFVFDNRDDDILAYNANNITYIIDDLPVLFGEHILYTPLSKLIILITSLP
jgi:hypothetical protein